MQPAVRKRLFQLIIGTVLVTLTLLELLLAAGCVKSPAPASTAPPPIASISPPAVQAAATNRFVGNTACKSCHPSEFSLHAASRHAITLHLADRHGLGRFMPPLGRIPGTDIVLSERQGSLVMAIAGETGDSMPLELAFGSGNTGMTYVAFLGAEAMELHKSYFPRLQKWYLTPGHEKQKPTDVGMLHNRTVTRECILCHAVTSPDVGVKPEPRFLG